MTRRRFKPPPRNRRFKKLFVIATEGEKTEPTYFKSLNTGRSVVSVKCVKGNTASSPGDVLKRMKKHINKKELIGGDEAWIVVDKDDWQDADLKTLLEWSQSQTNFGLAVSNPCFEYWLLLHFEDGNKVANEKACMTRLKKHMPHYAKGALDITKLESGVADAVRRAESRDKPRTKKWPTAVGTTVYRLVEKLTTTEEPSA